MHLDGSRRVRRIAAGCAMLALCLAPSVAWAGAGGGSLTGKVIATGGSSVTIETAGRRIGVVNALTSAANRITAQDYPYVYGGGHAQAGRASVGIPGPGYNGHRIGYDCSGSVAAVLAGANLWPSGSGVPNDAGIVAQLRQEGLIVPGVGRGPVEVTLYDDPGIHIFMNIDGRFFGTSDGGGGGNRRGGAGWLNDGAPDASSRSYHAYHFLPSALHGSTSGQTVTFQMAPDLLDQLRLGDKVTVGYRQTRAGILRATALTFPGAISVSGTVTAVSLDTFTLTPASGPSLAFAVLPGSNLVAGLSAGDTVRVTYTKSTSGLTARQLVFMARASG